MTTQEAIEILQANYPDACYEQLREAVDLSIYALKQMEEMKNDNQKNERPYQLP